jgi:hypothetical protein
VLNGLENQADFEAPKDAGQQTNLFQTEQQPAEPPKPTKEF